MARKQPPKTKGGKKLLQRRLKKVMKMTKSKSQIVTLRIPKELNEWLDRVRHLSYPKRITKQDLLVEGLIYAYLRRGEAHEAEVGAKDVLGFPLTELPK